jgi:hypothetical protein
MCLDFWNKSRDKKIDLIIGWLAVLTVALVIFMVWVVLNFYSVGQALSYNAQAMESLPAAYEFERGCEILSEVYHCNKDAWLFIKPTYEVWGNYVGDYNAINMSLMCQYYLKNPVATAEDCVNACWRCSGYVSGDVCTMDEDCPKISGSEPKCHLYESGYGLCTYK